MEGVQAWILKANGKINEAASSIASGYKGINFSCMDCAQDIMVALKAKGVKGELITLKSPHANIYSVSQGKNISTSGIHQGVLVDGLMYYNIHNGIKYDDWIKDFDAPFGRIRAEDSIKF